MPSNLPPRVEPHVLVTRDGSAFNANDSKRKLWMLNGKQPIRPNGKSKIITVSDFTTAGGRLMVSLSVSGE